MAESLMNDRGWRFHPLRDRLLAEAHSRPYVPLDAPMLATRIATLSGEDGTTVDRAHMIGICQRLGQPEPGPAATWCALESGTWQLRWERHTEFSTWTFFRSGNGEQVFAATALDLAPIDWIRSLPGDVIVATTLELRQAETVAAPLEPFASDAVAARLHDGGAALYTDFRQDGQGFTRFLMLVQDGDAALAGRLALSVLEIETYRIMALLAFPLAGEAASEMRRIEAEATALAETLAQDASPEADRGLLERLAALAGNAEALRARTSFRFGAARAYHEIVRNRIVTLRETRLDGRQTLAEFMERRLGPAMRTCDSVAQREHDAVERIARTQQLLETRVGIAAETTSLALLASMDRRAEAQLRLQRTVEGLSVAAISYYAVGLLLYVLKAGGLVIPGFKAELVAGLMTPLVVLGVWLVLQRLRSHIDREDGVRG